MDSPQKSELEKILKALEELNYTLFELIGEFYPDDVTCLENLRITWDGEAQAYRIKAYGEHSFSFISGDLIFVKSTKI